MSGYDLEVSFSFFSLEAKYMLIKYAINLPKTTSELVSSSPLRKKVELKGIVSKFRF